MVFSLWGEGGPNWLREEKLFYAEEDTEWTLVGRNGQAVVPVSGDRRDPVSPTVKAVSVFQRLSRDLNGVPNQSNPCNDRHSSHEEPSQDNMMERLDDQHAWDNVRCHACNQLGHVARQCQAPRLSGL